MKLKKILLLTFSRTFSLILSLALAGCAFAPGMKFDSNSPLDPSDPASIPVITPITLKLIQQENAEHAREKLRIDNYRELIGKPQPYRMGPADVLSIIVWDHPELVVPNLTYTLGATGNLSSSGMTSQTLPGYVISNEGEVQFPYIGQFQAGGLTEGEAQKKLREMLSKYIRDPQITLRVIGYRSQKIYVDGEVRAAGVKPITDVPMTLSEALNQAGGIPSSGDSSRITLVRGAKNYQLSVPAMIERNISPSTIVLLDDDVIRVAPLEENQISVAGEVLRPGSQPLRSNGRLSLSDALSGAGGVDANTSDPSAIYVVRAGADGGMPTVFHLDSKSPVGMALAENFALQAKDVVYVDAPGLVRFNRVVTQLVGSSTTAVNSRNAVDKKN